MKKSLTTLLLLILCFQGGAQTETQNAEPGMQNSESETQNPKPETRNLWSVSITPVYFQSREEILLGSRFGSVGIMVKPEWERRSERFIQSASLSVCFAEPKTRIEPVRASVLISAGLKYAFEYIVYEGRAGMFAVGGEAMVNYTLEYLPVLDDSHLFWTTFMGIGPQVRWERAVRTKNRLYARLDVPLAGFLSRPPAYWDYKAINSSLGNILSTINSDLHPVFMNRYFSPSLEVGYRVKQSDRFTIGFHYSLDYLYARSSQSNPYVELIQGIGIQFIF
ncbi:MAG: hypothetical protein IH596_03715 [Bacteroidales bacterium]|nr:hypothetical protein [Bacteroidales bacterium]